MKISTKTLTALMAIAFATASFTSNAQDDDTSLRVGKIDQVLKSSEGLELKSNGFGNTQAANLIKANGDLIQQSGIITQTIELQDELKLKQANIGSRQAANYVGATGKATLAEVSQSVTGASAVTLDQIGSHLSVQGVNVVESGASIIPVDEFTGIAAGIVDTVIEVAVGKLKDEAVDTAKDLIPGI